MPRKREIFKAALKNTFVIGTSSSLAAPTTIISGQPTPSTSTHHPQNVPTKDLWDLALQKLSADQRSALSQFKPEAKLEMLQHLQAAIKHKQELCDAKRWKFELFGRQLILRDIAAKIIDLVQTFKDIGDIAVNFDPVHIALPWAGVRFLLEVSQPHALLAGDSN